LNKNLSIEILACRLLDMKGKSNIVIRIFGRELLNKISMWN
jgi:hypothetical protein